MTGAWKYVASTVVVGPSGQPVVTRGYMEIGGMRIYDDQMQVGPRGEHVISLGWTEFPSATESYGQPED